MIKHILFDMDGALADSAKAIIPVLLQVSKNFELPPVSDDAVWQTIGCGSPDFYFRLYPHKSRRLMLEYAEEADRLVEAAIWDIGASILWPGVLTMLESLVLRRVSLCVISAAQASYVNAVLTTAGIQHFFDVIAYGESNQEALVRQVLYGDLSRWALVGNTLKSLAAARANGIFSLAAGFGYISTKDAALFDRVLKTPGSIVNWL